MGNDYLHIAFVIRSTGVLLLLLIALLWPIKKILSEPSSLIFYFFIIVTLFKGIVHFFAPSVPLAAQDTVSFLLHTLQGALLINYLSGRITTRLQSRLNYLLTAAISVSLTLYASGNTSIAWTLTTYFNVFLSATLALSALMALVKKSPLLFFKEELFWISLGAGFFSLMHLLFSALLLTGWYEKGGAAEFSLLMDFFNVIQYGCFLLATLQSGYPEEPMA